MLKVLAIAVGVGAALLCASTLSAQPVMDSPHRTQSDFRKMRAHVGDYLYVSDPDRRIEVGGRVTALSDGELTIDGYRFTPKPGLKIERTGDAIWDGAVTGFLIGGLLGTTVGAEGCLHSSMAPCFFVNGAFLGAVGAWIDHQHNGRTVVFLGGSAAKGQPDPDPESMPALIPVAFDFAALGLKVGDRIAITAADGTQTTGRISVMNDHAFRVGAVDLAQVSPVQVDRLGDPIWDGAAYGAGFGLMASLMGEPTRRSVTTTAVVFGIIGAAIDACRSGRTTVFGGSDPLGRSSSLRLVPEIGPHTRAATLIVRF